MSFIIEPLEKRVCCAALEGAVLYGDANLDGVIDSSDYSLIDNGFNLGLHGWGNGDFSGDGKVDAADYSLLDNAFAGGPQVGTIYRVGPDQPLTTIASAAALAQPGDTVLIDPGIYHEQITLPISGTADQPITFAADGWDPVTIDGTGFDYIWNGGNGWGGQSGIRVAGITFQNCANPLQYGAVVVGSNSTFSDCVIQNVDGAGMILQGGGISFNTRVTAQYNGEDGIDGNSCGDVTAADCIVANNNTGMVAPNWAGSLYSVESNGLWYSTLENGGSEWTRTDNVTLTGWQVYGNGGPGMHFDADNRNTTITGCTFGGDPLYPGESPYDNSELEYEICLGPALISNNTFAPNAGDGLTVATSANVTVTGNTFTGNSVSWTNWYRGAAYSETGETFTNNVLIGSTVWWGGGNSYSWNTATAAAENLVSDFNTYSDLPISGFVYWGSHGPLNTLRAMQRYGIEANGMIAS